MSQLPTRRQVSEAISIAHHALAAAYVANCAENQDWAAQRGSRGHKGSRLDACLYLAEKSLDVVKGDMFEEACKEVSRRLAGHGVYGYLWSAAHTVLSDVWNEEISSYVLGRVSECGEYSEDNLRRYVREARAVRRFTIMPHMWADQGDGESWYWKAVWHMSDIADIVEHCREEWGDGTVYGSIDDKTFLLQKDVFKRELACELLDCCHIDGYYGAVGRPFADNVSVKVTDTHVVISQSGGLDI